MRAPRAQAPAAVLSQGFSYRKRTKPEDGIGSHCSIPVQINDFPNNNQKMSCIDDRLMAALFSLLF